MVTFKHTTYNLPLYQNSSIFFLFVFSDLFPKKYITEPFIYFVSSKQAQSQSKQAAKWLKSCSKTSVTYGGAIWVCIWVETRQGETGGHFPIAETKIVHIFFVIWQGLV